MPRRRRPALVLAALVLGAVGLTLARVPVSLRGARLPSLRLAHVPLRSLRAERADLSGSDLHKADLRHARFDHATLTGTNFCAATLLEAHFSGANLHQANLQRANLLHANFTRANLTAADLRYANAAHANFTDADLTGANLSVWFSDAGADFCETTLVRANLTDTNLTSTTLCGADLRGANLHNAILSDATLENVQNLDQANLDGVVFSLSGTVWPEGNGKWPRHGTVNGVAVTYRLETLPNQPDLRRLEATLSPHPAPRP